MEVTKLTASRLEIIGENILYNNGVIHAFYVLPLSNYSVASYNGIENNVESLTNLLTTLAAQRPGVSFSIQRCTKIIKAEDIKNNLLETIKIYAPDYEMPVEFTSKLTNAEQEYCLLAISIDPNDIASVEESTLLETAKSLVKQTANRLLATGGDLDIPKILSIEENIYSCIREKCTRASQDLVFYNYVSKLYPSYELSYDQLSYFNINTYTAILGSVTQTLEDKFGSFVMHNEGVDIFGLIPQDTYGCLLNISEFPESIDTANFPMIFPNTQVNIKVLKKEEAALTIKRKRSSIQWEYKEAATADAPVDQLSALEDEFSLANFAVRNIEQGEPICRFSVSILVLGRTPEELKNMTNLIISKLKDRKIAPTKSLTQAKDFFNSYLKLTPQNYTHMATLKFPLSFQQNYGCTVGDFDSGLSVPSIGEDI